MKNCLSFILSLHQLCSFQTIEGKKVGKASNSEIRRWFQARCIEINCQTDWSWDEELPPVIYSLVLFPKNKTKRCTLY
jgi:hypothetical protein